MSAAAGQPPQSDLLAQCDEVAVIVTDLAGRIRTFNRGAEVSVGCRADEAIGRRMVDVVAGPNEAPWIAAILAEVRERGIWRGRMDARRRDGSHFSTRTQATLLRDGTGAPTGIAGVCVDISDEVRRRRDDVDDRLRSLARSLGEGLLRFDAAGRLVDLNEAASLMLGYRAEHLSGPVCHDSIHPRAQSTPHAFAECPLACAVAGDGRPPVRLDTFVRADGSRLAVAYTAAPLADQDGRTGSAVVFHPETG